jgi:hypothetical protein
MSTVSLPPRKTNEVAACNSPEMPQQFSNWIDAEYFQHEPEDVHLRVKLLRVDELEDVENSLSNLTKLQSIASICWRERNFVFVKFIARY